MIAWMSCQHILAPLWCAQFILRDGVRDLYMLGDTPYCNQFGAGYGFEEAVDKVMLPGNASVADIKRRHDQMWSKRGFTEFKAARAAGALRVYYMADDHEYYGDNWDHSLVQANGAFNLGAANVDDLADGYQRMAQAAIQCIGSGPGQYYDNPAPGANTEGDFPSGSNAGHAAKYLKRYFANDYGPGFEPGGAWLRVIVPDCITYRSVLAEPDTAAKVMLGATQQAWLLAQIVQAHTAGFAHIVVMSPKKLFRAASGGDNSDTWGEYSANRDQVLDAIQASGARVIWCTGDRHTPQVAQARTAQGAAHDLIDICACPVGQNINNGGGPGTAAQGRYAQLRWYANANVYGQIARTDAGGLRIAVRNARTDSEMWAAEFAPRSNLPIYAEPTAVRV